MIGGLLFVTLGSMAFIPALLVQLKITSYDLAQTLALPIGIALGALAGYFLSLTTRVLAMVVDDLHAIRSYLAGYNVYEEEREP